MAGAGWYPDPQGRPGHVRYWDGQAWVGAAARDNVPSGTAQPAGNRRWLWIALVVVVVVAFAWGVWGGARDALTGDPVETARPTGSAWNELPISSPPTPEVSGTPTNEESVDCPVIDNVRDTHPEDGRIHGGGLSIAYPAGWDPYSGFSVVLTDEAAAWKAFPDSGWSSFISVGQAPVAEGFIDLSTTARQIIECHVSSGYFTGFSGRDVLRSEAVVVDGRSAWHVAEQVRSTSVPGESVTFDVVVVDTGEGRGFGVYWTGIIDADEEAKQAQQRARESLILSD